MKKVISIVMAVLVLMFSFAVVANAESTDTNCIYFQVPTESSVAWKNFSNVYCHIWEEGGDVLFSWQSKDEKCTDLGNGYFSYDLSPFEFKEDGKYAVIFSNENGLQTYDLTITSDCKGDYVFCNGDICKNPVDSAKNCSVARWKNNSDKVFPCAKEDSDGKLTDPDSITGKDVNLNFGSSVGKSVELDEVKIEETTQKVTEENINNKTTATQQQRNNSTLYILLAIIAVVVIVAVIVIVVLASKKRKK